MQLSKSQEFGSPGDGRDRTGGLLLAKQALSQLSYVPFEPGPLSAHGRKRDRTSDTRLIKTVLYQLSYAPDRKKCRTPSSQDDAGGVNRKIRKEVIQPHLPVRLPCYDLAPVTSFTFVGALPCGLGYQLRVPPASIA